MKKQQKTYLLLVAVIAIWGMIGFQIYQRLNPSIVPIESLKIETNFQRQKVSETNYYDLKESYRDPFLADYPQKKTIIKKSLPKKILPTIPFPTIQYIGIIESNNTQSYILTINGKQEILKKGEVIQGIKLIKANQEEATVQFQKETKTIIKQ